MNQQLFRQFEALEKSRSVLFENLIALSDEDARKAPAGKWSISEIVSHILTSEQMSLGYMKKKSLAIDTLDNSGIAESMRMVLLTLSQRLPIKYKAPKIIVERTLQRESFQTTLQEWASLRNEYREFLERIEDKNLRKKIYKHPIAGRLNSFQALKFLREHFRHHLPQINRLLKK
ncbi:MAG: DinB family protein [Flammeovirgaceae bacterium]|nr:DinB family protein [Flammeovirgaceae bacterium]